ncbi:hypothetical protein DFH09DRAFT_1228379 [Mycena vulgaris]|nr:hypothetical protein DFH09DRAFT_1228379 [Mycena vulgaris]
MFVPFVTSKKQLSKRRGDDKSGGAKGGGGAEGAGGTSRSTPVSTSGTANLAAAPPGSPDISSSPPHRDDGASIITNPLSLILSSRSSVRFQPTRFARWDNKHELRKPSISLSDIEPTAFYFRWNELAKVDLKNRNTLDYIDGPLHSLWTTGGIWPGGASLARSPTNLSGKGHRAGPSVPLRHDESQTYHDEASTITIPPPTLSSRSSVRFQPTSLALQDNKPELGNPSILLPPVDDRNTDQRKGSNATFASTSDADLESQISHSDESPKFRIGRVKTTVKNSALLTILFAGTAAQLLGVIRGDNALDDATKFQLNLLNLVSYTAILLNVMATIASIFLIHALNEINFDEAPHHAIAGKLRSGAFQDPNIKWVFLQWMVYGSLGMIFMIIQPLAYVWLREDPSMSIWVTMATGSATLGLFVVWWSR